MGVWDQLKDWYITAALLLLLAATGGFIGSMIRMLDAHQRISWLVVAVETAASAFSGVIVMLLCQALGFNLQWTGVIVGVCGWFGGRTTMLWMEKRVRRIVEGELK